MTSIEMLARLRTLLDETPEGFWDDDLDAYPYLAQAQLEVIRRIARFKPIALRQLVTRGALTAQTFAIDTGVALAGDFFLIYSIKANATGGTEKPCYERSERNDYSDNPYLSSESDRLYYSISGNPLKLYFETNFVNGTVTLDYITKPDDIDATTDPEIDETAHMAIVYGAYSSLLLKAKLDNSRALEVFEKELKTLI